MTVLSDEFLDAFSVIEKELSRRRATDEHETFGHMLRSLEKKDRLIESYSADLQYMAKIRNVLAHDRRFKSATVVDPHQELVDLIKLIAGKLTDPPRVDSQFVNTVITCTRSEHVGKVAKRMATTNLSSLPVVDGSESVTDLFTSSTIARWYGSVLDGDLVEDATVGDALEHTEDLRHLGFIKRSANSAVALGMFERAEMNGVSLAAIVITESGKASKPLGVIAPFDIPALHRSLSCTTK